MIKKLLVTVVLIAINYSLLSQTSIGLKAGYNYSTAKVSVKSSKQETEYKNGYSFGIMFKAPFDGALHFSPYIAYSRRGYIYHPDSASLKKIENIIHYIDIAPGFSFDFPVSSRSTFMVGFSPVFGFALSGKEKNTFSGDSVSIKNMLFSFTNYGAYDIGLTGNIGFRLNKKILVEASYYYGLANIENFEAHSRNIQHRMFNFSLGYYIK